MSFELAAKKVIDFTAQMTGREAKLVRLEKQPEGWLGIAEVFEESAFIKAIGLPSRVMDKNMYEVRLNPSLDVVSYVKQELKSTS